MLSSYFNVGIQELGLEKIITAYSPDPNVSGAQFLIIDIDDWVIQADTQYTLYIRNKPSTSQSVKVFWGSQYSDWTLTDADGVAYNDKTMDMAIRIIE